MGIVRAVWLAQRAAVDASGATFARRQAPAVAGTGAGRPEGEYLDAALAALIASSRPDVCPNTARDTFTRWRGDSRYTPDGLLLAEGPEHLLGAALIYPAKHSNVDEPSEALLADLIISPNLNRATTDDIRTALVAAALRAGAAAVASKARAVTDDPDLIATLLAAGFEPLDQIRHYTGPWPPLSIVLVLVFSAVVSTQPTTRGREALMLESVTADYQSATAVHPTS